jgi:hypothetical protein
VDASDFGRYLVQQREFRGLSREEVASATKIPLALVGALEEGQLGALPGRVFVVNFVRSYAQAIGLEPDDALLRFEEASPSPVRAEPPAPVRGRKSPGVGTPSPFTPAGRGRKSPGAGTPAPRALATRARRAGLGVLVLGLAVLGLWLLLRRH